MEATRVAKVLLVRQIKSFLMRHLLLSREQADHCKRFEYYTQTIYPHYKDYFFAPIWEHTRPSLLHSIPRFVMHAIASIWTGSHHLQCETRRWHAACLTRTPPLEKLCTLCYQGTIEFEQHSFSECDAYSSTKQNFKTIVSWHLYITVFLHQCGQTLAMGAYSEWYWRQYFDH